MKGTAPTPSWVTDYPKLVPKGLFPKLGDLPDPNPEAADPDFTTKWLSERMDSVLDLASTDPIIGPAENHFISPQFADWLKQRWELPGFNNCTEGEHFTLSILLEPRMSRFN